MMRACIGVEFIDDLWFNQGAEKKEEEERLAKLNHNLMKALLEDKTFDS